MYNKSEIFKEAWRSVKAYNISISTALKIAWAKAKTTTNKDSKIAALVAAGASRWTKNGMDRLYINAKVLGLECTYYKSGAVSYATFKGEKISNGEASRMRAMKAYVDCKDLSVHCDYKYLENEVNEFVAKAM